MGLGEAHKATTEEKRDAEILALLSWNYAELPPLIADLLMDAAAEGAWQGAHQIHAEVGGEFAPFHQAATEQAQVWASERAHELAGETTHPQMAISETAKAEIKRTVSQAIEENWTPQQLEAAIEGSTLFTAAHAALIADAEVARAQSFGWQKAWQESRVVAEVAWKTEPAPNRCCDECYGYEHEGSVKVGHEFGGKYLAPPAHPHCKCDLIITKFKGDTDE